MDKLFLIHLGYYDEIGNGVYESHTNLFIVASDFENAKEKAKQLDIVKLKKMHIDGIQLVEAVGGYIVRLQVDSSLNGQDIITNDKFRELAPKSENNQNEI